jgi:hypothetical protein
MKPPIRLVPTLCLEVAASAQLHPPVHDRGRILPIVKRAGCDELGEDTFDVEAACLCVSKSGEAWARRDQTIA